MDAKVAKDLEGLLIPIDSVQSHPSNPRRGDIVGIAESLDVNGQFTPIVVDMRNGNILAGNHTWKAAKSLGWDEIAVTYLDVNDQQAKRILLADNRTSDLATYDRPDLIELIERLTPDFSGSGWDAQSLDKLKWLELQDSEEDIFSGGESTRGQDEETAKTKKIHVGKNLLLVDSDYLDEWFQDLVDGFGGKKEAMAEVRGRLGLTLNPQKAQKGKGKEWGHISGETPAHEALRGCTWVPIDSVAQHPENARQGDVGALSESIRVNGLYRPLTVQRETGLILKGNNTWEALVALGWSEVPVVFLDVDDEEAIRVMLADNRLADKAGYYNTALASILMDLDSLDGTGFEPIDIDTILKDLPQEGDVAAKIGAPSDVKRVANIRVGGNQVNTCGAQYAEWEQQMIADGYMSKEERGYRIGEMLGLDPSQYMPWASVADPTTGHNKLKR